MHEAEVIERIKELCMLRKWTYYRLAKEAGISYSTLSTMLHKTVTPSIPTLVKLCEGFGITLAQFFSPEDDTAKLTADEKACLGLWNRLDDTGKELTRVYMTALADRQTKESDEGRGGRG